MVRVGDGGGLFEYDFSSGKLFSNSEKETGSYFLNIIGSHDGSFVGLLKSCPMIIHACILRTEGCLVFSLLPIQINSLYTHLKEPY